MQSQKSDLLFLVAAIIFLALTYLPLFAKENILDAFVREDGIFEDLTALYFFGTFILFAVALFHLRPISWLMKLSYAGLALLFLFGAGEEISWGERIFDWDDHNFIRGINVQEELTIHNLKYFQGEDAIIPISTSQIFTVFAFIIAVLIPLAGRPSPKLERFIASRFPVLPLKFGILVVATYIFQKAMVRLLPIFPMLYHHPSMPIPQGVHEIREHGYAFALFTSSLFYYLRKRATKPAEEINATSGILTNPGPANSYR